MPATFNWGIIGLGRIARKFADDLRLIPGARLHAVASTDQARAREFAAAYGAGFAYGSYEAIVQCPDLHAVYIATPHNLHATGARIALEAGIPTLVEKPFAMYYGEALQMIETARRHRTFLMEALWTRFIPGVEFALEKAEAGEIGPIHSITADFGFKTAFDPASRIFNKTLGGGALLDIGIYPALLALSVLGKPEFDDIHALATFSDTGVDETCAFAFRYPGNRTALGHATLKAHTPVEACLYGAGGHIYLHPRWHHTQKVSIVRYDDSNRPLPALTHDFPYEGWGYHFEATHVMACLAEGRLESETVPLDFTLDLAATLDAVREKIGLEYE